MKRYSTPYRHDRKNDRNKIERGNSKSHSYLRNYDKDDAAWEAASERKKIGTVKEAVDIKGLTDSLKDMFKCY